jgi:hypothetical protein
VREEAHDEAREERKPRTDAHELERQLQPRGGGGRRRLGKRVRAAFSTSRWKEVGNEVRLLGAGAAGACLYAPASL